MKKFNKKEKNKQGWRVFNSPSLLCCHQCRSRRLIAYTIRPPITIIISFPAEIFAIVSPHERKKASQLPVQRASEPGSVTHVRNTTRMVTTINTSFFFMVSFSFLSYRRYGEYCHQDNP